jgi:hypothetical protein
LAAISAIRQPAQNDTGAAVKEGSAEFFAVPVIKRVGSSCK